MRTRRGLRAVLIEGQASGDLNGTGRWELQARQGPRRVRYEWRVRADKPWMRLLAPLWRPIYVWNHGGVMRAGSEGFLRPPAAR